jgi:hypothetical protein
VLRARQGYRTQVPSVSTQKGRTKQVSFKDGIDTYSDNDDVKITSLNAAIDARMIRRGRYKTRKGLDRFSIPVGEADNVTLTATTGATDAVVSGTGAVAQKLVVSGAGRATKAEIRIKAATGQSGVVVVELCSDSAGQPGTVLARSSLTPSSISTSYAYLPAYFVKAPALTNGQTVWLVVRTQSATSGTFNVSATSSVSTGLSSATGGTTWATTTTGFNVKLSTTPENAVKGLIRVNRPNGLNYTLFQAGTNQYSVNESTGVATSIQGSMSALATKYRYEVIQDAVYWVNGYAQPYKWDFTTVTQDDNAPFLPDLIIEHAGLMFIAREDDSKVAWSKFGEYQEWKSTDFSYFLAPKTPFTVTAFAKLNGVLYVFAAKNKYQLLGEDNQSFSASEAMSQRGTFSQESCIYDDNNIYHADNDGIWMFNGTEERNLAEDFLEDYRAIPNKNSIVLEKFKNRLYVFHTSLGSATNDQCYVINLDIKKYESLDKNTHVSRAYSRKDKTNLFLQASTVVPAIYVAEQDSNDYHNLGDQMEFELQTAFTHFDSPGQYKTVPKWRPEFASVDGMYSVQCGYAKDFENTATWQDFDVAGGGLRWDSGWHWDDGSRYSTGGNLQATSLLISGTFRRLQRRYKHVAAREPVEFDSEVLEVQTQRLR